MPELAGSKLELEAMLTEPVVEPAVVEKGCLRSGTGSFDLGRVDGDRIVTGGLQPGDKVIVDGLLNATPGQAVSPVDETQSFVASSAN